MALLDRRQPGRVTPAAEAEGGARPKDQPKGCMLSVHHLAVVVRDLARAEAFYAGLLGLPVLARHADAQGAPRSVWLSLDGGGGGGDRGDRGAPFLALERATADAPRRRDEAPGWH